jgi:hypothetical protein
VIVAKWADHQPLHRQEKMFERHGIDISRKTMGGWMAQSAELLDPLYQLMKKELLNSKVIGADDIPPIVPPAFMPPPACPRPCAEADDTNSSVMTAPVAYRLRLFCF